MDVLAALTIVCLGFSGYSLMGTSIAGVLIIFLMFLLLFRLEYFSKLIMKLSQTLPLIIRTDSMLKEFKAMLSLKYFIYVKAF